MEALGSPLLFNPNKKTTGRFGILNPQYGIPMTDEQKQKISASKKGKPQSEEHKKKMSESLKRYFQNKNKII